MLYPAIDLHSNQIAFCVRNGKGDTVLRHQVSTNPDKIKSFHEQLIEMDSDVYGGVCVFKL